MHSAHAIVGGMTCDRNFVAGLEGSGVPSLARQDTRIGKFTLPFLNVPFAVLCFELHHAVRIDVMEVYYSSFESDFRGLIKFRPSVVCSGRSRY